MHILYADDADVNGRYCDVGFILSEVLKLQDICVSTR